MDHVAGGKKTVVEEGTRFKGTLTSSCPVLVNGEIEGEVETPSLSVSASGAVRGKAKVGEVDSKGEIEGEFDADTIRLAGKVRDNTVLKAKTLEVKLSVDGKMQVVFGECELSVGDSPTEASTSEDASGADEGKKKKNKRENRNSEAPQS